ncbi:MAG: hypothetical protein K6B74_11570 [Ruminococcus sp.]|nr:hypothetical protein [Ruminococcus sp.]
MKTTEIKRNSSFELMRIICMFMILCLHANKDMLFTHDYAIPRYIKAFMTVSESLCISAVNCFVLITGYFMITSSRLKIRKAAELVVLTSGYGLTFFIIMCLCGKCYFSFEVMLSCAAPYFYDKVWFINIYLVLILLAPFVNKGLTALSKDSYRLLLVIVLILFSVWPSFFPNPPQQDKGYGIVSFLMIYMIGGYIRLHTERQKKPVKYLAAYIALSAVTAVLFHSGVIAGDWLSYNSVFIVASSVCLFLVFRSFEINSEKLNLVSRSAIAVYIIHAHQLIRPHIFIDWLKLPDKLGSPAFIAVYLGGLLLICAVCLAIDIPRRILDKRVTSKVLDKVSFFNITKDI